MPLQLSKKRKRSLRHLKLLSRELMLLQQRQRQIRKTQRVIIKALSTKMMMTMIMMELISMRMMTTPPICLLARKPRCWRI